MAKGMSLPEKRMSRFNVANWPKFTALFSVSFPDNRAALWTQQTRSSILRRYSPDIPHLFVAWCIDSSLKRSFDVFIFYFCLSLNHPHARTWQREKQCLARYKGFTKQCQQNTRCACIWRQIDFKEGDRLSPKPEYTWWICVFDKPLMLSTTVALNIVLHVRCVARRCGLSLSNSTQWSACFFVFLDNCRQPRAEPSKFASKWETKEKQTS